MKVIERDLFTFFIFTIFITSSCTKEISGGRKGDGSVGKTGTDNFDTHCFIDRSSSDLMVDNKFVKQTTQNFSVSCEQVNQSSNAVTPLDPICFDNNVEVDCDSGILSVTDADGGSHSVKVTAVDSKGNSVPEGGPITFFIDRLGPSVNSATVNETGSFGERLVILNFTATDNPNPDGVGVDATNFHCSVRESSASGTLLTPTRANGSALTSVGSGFFKCENGLTIKIPATGNDGPFFFTVKSNDRLANVGTPVNFPSGGFNFTPPPPQAPIISLGSFKDNNNINLNSNAPTINNDSVITAGCIPGNSRFPLTAIVNCDSNCNNDIDWMCSDIPFTSDPSSGQICNGNSSASSSSLAEIIEANRIGSGCNHTLFIRAVSGALVSNTIQVRFNADITVPFVDSIVDFDEDNDGVIETSERKKETVYQLFKAQTCASGTGTCLLDKLFYGANDAGCKAGMTMSCKVKDPNTGFDSGFFNCIEVTSANCPDGSSACSEFDRNIQTILIGGGSSPTSLNPDDRGAKNNLIFEFKSCDGANNCVTASTAANPSIVHSDPCDGILPSGFTSSNCKSSIDNTGGNTTNGTTINPYDPYGPNQPQFPF